MQPSEVKDLLAALGTHNWIAIATLVTFVLVRICKDDRYVRFWPVAISPEWRPRFALLFGLVYGVVQKLATGGTWTEALAGGFLAGFLAIGGHELVVESFRQGRDIGVPKPTAPLPSPPMFPASLFPATGSKRPPPISIKPAAPKEPPPS